MVYNSVLIPVLPVDVVEADSAEDLGAVTASPTPIADLVGKAILAAGLGLEFELPTQVKLQHYLCSLTYGTQIIDYYSYRT